MENRFIIDREKSKEHWLELISEYEDYYVIAKWDGCIDLRKAYNGTKANNSNNTDKDYIHICDIDEFIKILQEIKEKAQTWFNDNGDWG